jgi:hypothetical protein
MRSGTDSRKQLPAHPQRAQQPRRTQTLRRAPAKPFVHSEQSSIHIHTGAAALGLHSAPHWNASVREGECERVQFVAGMAVENGTHIRISYGLGDCESRMLSLPLDFVVGLTRMA